MYIKKIIIIIIIVITLFESQIILAEHFLSSSSINHLNLLAFYHERRSLIGYATHYLFCDSEWKMEVTSWCFQSVCEEDLDKVLNNQ